MIKINKLVIQGFKSFKKEQVLDFDSFNTGFYYIGGENKLEPELGPNGVGKCLKDSTIITDCISGKRCSIQEWYSLLKSGKELHVLSLDEDLKLCSTKVVTVFKTGKKEILRIYLRDGAFVDVSKEHPLIGVNGCMKAKDVTVGDYVQTPRHLKSLSLTNKTLFDNDDIIIMSSLLADGCLTSKLGGYTFTKTDKHIVQLLSKSLSNKHLLLYKIKRKIHYDIRNKRGACYYSEFTNDINDLIKKYNIKLNAIVNNSARVLQGRSLLKYDTLYKLSNDTGYTEFSELADKLYPVSVLKNRFKKLGFHGKLSKNKKLHSDCYLMTNKQLKLFISVFWACDGYVGDINKKSQEISLGLASKDLIFDFKSLLLRFSITSKVRYKRIKNKYDCWILTPIGRESIINLCSLLQDMPSVLKRDRVRLIKQQVLKKDVNNNLDNVPFEVTRKALLLAEKNTGKKIRKYPKFGLSYDRQQILEDGHDIGRDTLQKYAKYFDNDESLLLLANSDILWQKIEKIEKLPNSFETYDLQVQSKTHLYALESIITHNSTLFDALCWVFFGQTLPKRFDLNTGLKGDSIESWNTEERCFVECTFFIDNTEILLRRSRNPNCLEIKYNKDYVDFVTKEQHEIEELIGYNYSSFVYSIIIPQFGAKFFDLSAADKLDIFSDIMKLDNWLAYSDKAKNSVGKLDNFIIDDERRLAGIVGEIKGLQAQDFSKQVEEWEQSIQIKKKEVTQNLKEVSNVLRLLEKEVTENRNKIDIQTTQQRKFIKTIEGFNTEIETKNIDADACYKKSWECKNIIQQTESKIKKFRTLNADCPWCFQKVGDKHKSVIKKESKAELGSLKKEAVVTNDEVVTSELELKNVTNKKEKVVNQLDTVGDRIFDLNKEYEQSKNDIKSEGKEKKRLDQALHNTNIEINPYQDIIEQNKIKEEGLITQKLRLQSKLQGLKTKKEVNKYWVKGFKEIRLSIIEQTLDELELEINNNMYNLGLIDWSVKLSVDFETKGGKIKKGLHIVVQSPFNSKSVPFEVWSGGERQRICLAGTLGLSDLIRNRLGDWNIECVDEPTAWLADEGISDVLTLLQKRSVDYNRKVFIADHRNFISDGMFDGVIQIVKDKNGSSIN